MPARPAKNEPSTLQVFWLAEFIICGEMISSTLAVVCILGLSPLIHQILFRVTLFEPYTDITSQWQQIKPSTRNDALTFMIPFVSAGRKMSFSRSLYCSLLRHNLFIAKIALYKQYFPHLKYYFLYLQIFLPKTTTRKDTTGIWVQHLPCFVLFFFLSLRI